MGRGQARGPGPVRQLAAPVARGARGGNITRLPRAVDHCSASTINRKLSAVGSFYQFHQRHGVEYEFMWSLRRGGSTGSWRPFLAHLGESPRRRREVKLKTTSGFHGCSRPIKSPQ